MKTMLACGGLSLLAELLTAQGSAGTVRGIIRDRTDAVIADVEVLARQAGRRDVSDQSGGFILPGLTPGFHVVVVRKLGFAADSQRVEVRGGDTTAVVFTLDARVTNLPEVDVVAPNSKSARLEGFERRRTGRSGGQFITRETIERRGSSRTTDYLRGVPGIQMVDSLGATIAISSRGAKVNLTSRKQVEACVVRLGVDGIIKDPLFSINLIPPTDVHGIEVYAGAATIPPEFNSTAGRNAHCGLIMIWTRSR